MSMFRHAQGSILLEGLQAVIEGLPGTQALSQLGRSGSAAAGERLYSSNSSNSIAWPQPGRSGICGAASVTDLNVCSTSRVSSEATAVGWFSAWPGSSVLDAAPGKRFYAVNNKPDVVYIRAQKSKQSHYKDEPTNYVQLLACIKHCGSLQRLHQLVTQYHTLFDAVHLAAAISALPKVLEYRPQDMEASTSVVTGAGVLAKKPRYAAKLRESHVDKGAELAAMLDAMIPQHVHRFFPRQCATSVWAFGQLAAKGVCTTFPHLEQLLLAIKHSDYEQLRVHGNAVDVAQLLKGLANLEHQDAILVNNLAGYLVANIGAFKARELQMAVTGLAGLGHRDQATYDAIATQAIKHAAFFTPLGIARVIGAFAHAGHVHKGMLDALSAGLAPQFMLISPQDVAGLVQSYARLGYRNDAALDIIGNIAVDLLPKFPDALLAQALRGYAALGVYHAKLFGAVAHGILSEPQIGSSPALLVQVVSAYTSLNCHEAAEADAVGRLVDNLSGRVHTLGAAQLAELSHAASTSGQVHEACMQSVASRAVQVMDDFTAPQLLKLLKGYNAPGATLQFQLAVSAARHVAKLVKYAPAGMLIDCLYECHLQGVHDTQTAQDVLTSVQGSLDSVKARADWVAKAYICAHKMSASAHPAVSELQRAIEVAKLDDKLAQEVKLLPATKA